MSVIDEFAKAAMVGILSCPSRYQLVIDDDGGINKEALAIESYAIARHMALQRLAETKTRPVDTTDWP